MMNKIGVKTIVGSVVTIVYILSTSLALIKLISRQSNSYEAVIFPSLFFLAGLAIFSTPAENLLQFDRRTGYFLYKMAPNKEGGLRYASIFYTIFGLVFMLVPALISLVVFFTHGQ